MSVNNYLVGYVDPAHFEQISVDLYLYHSPLQNRDYELKFNRETGRWECNCPDIRYNKKNHVDKRCKHEIALNIKLRDTVRNRCMAEIEAEEAALQAEARAEQEAQGIEDIYSLINGMNDHYKREIESLKEQLADARAAVSQSQPADLEEIKAELSALRAENEQIKKQLATKATARKKHQSETEAAEIKEIINGNLDEAMQAAKTAIKAAEMARENIAALESIPHHLKAELDRWTETGKEELQPDYKPAEANSDEVRSEIRKIKDGLAAKIKEEEKRRNAPLHLSSEYLLCLSCASSASFFVQL